MVHMPTLSIILVNYKVPHFLEHCLLSVRRASVGMDVETIVVDNASGDGSIELLSPRFPEVNFIQSDQNLGFAKASNLGYRASSGSIVLFLNPDTLLSEGSLRGSVEYLINNPQTGSLGIRMIDGTGRFLPESKRAFPDPATAFYKIIGLAKLFPRSPRFARYHLGHLSPDQDHSIDVVSGAFFMAPRAVLEKVGLFDEDFFMYGEDVDLSYRIRQAGYSNHYFSGSTILHFKGESTQKQSVKYVKLFYGAMSQFVRKHRLNNGFFRGGIQIAIALRAMASLFRRVIQRVGIPIFDWALILMSFFLARYGWSTQVRPEVNYPSDFSLPLSAYALIFYLTTFFSGVHSAPFRWKNHFRSLLMASGVLLVVYSLLPESLRYSRGIVTVGSIASIGLITAWRLLLLRLQLISRFTEQHLQFPLLFIGTEKSRRDIQRLYPDQPPAAFLLLEPESSTDLLVKRLDDYYSIIRFSDVVCCLDDLPAQLVFDLMMRPGNHFSYRFYASGAEAILPLRKW